PDTKIHLAVEEMFSDIAALRAEADAGGPTPDAAYPLTLCAGERRSSNATTNYRDPAWRAVDTGGALRIHRDDAVRFGIADGDAVVCESRAGSVRATAQYDDSVQRGAVSLPHGFGLKYTDADGKRVSHGPLINLLSS